jgi:hypothetical protein
MRPTGSTEDRTWLYRSGEAESKERQRMFRVLPNGPGIELPAAREGTTPGPADARRAHREPGGRRLEARQADPVAAGQLQCLVRPRSPASNSPAQDAPDA